MRVPSPSLNVQARALSTIAQAGSESTSRISWLLVGLGNPGKPYQGTRHNVGFEVIDALGHSEGIMLSTTQYKATIGIGEIGSSKVLLAKPQTFMNLSGESVGPLAAYYEVPTQRILVIFDDMDLEFATMRLLPKGSHGGHNGMRSVVQHLNGSHDFPRLKIGIGRPPGETDPAEFVLRKCSETERERMDATIARGLCAIRQVILNGIQKACSTCNAPCKIKAKGRNEQDNGKAKRSNVAENSCKSERMEDEPGSNVAENSSKSKTAGSNSDVDS